MAIATKRARFNVKGFTSFVLVVASGVMAASGIVLYVGPHGRVAHMTGWTSLGLGKGQWTNLHMTTALLFLIVAVFHLVWNWSLLWGYVKNKAAAGLNLKLELAVALLVGVVVVGGTIMDVPPFRSFIQLKRTIGNLWSGPAGDAAGGHGQGPGRGQGAGQGQGRQYRGGRPSQDR